LEKFLADRGITVRFAAFEEIARLNSANLDTWDLLLPMLDSKQHPVEPENALAFLAYDANETIIASMAARLFDFRGTTLKDEVESLSFYYGSNATNARSRVRSSISAPTAERMSGPSAYLGGYWLRPDVRSTGLSVHLPRLMRYIALTTWNAELEFSYGRNNFLRPEIAKTYGFEHVEKEFDFFLEDRLIWRGVLVWTGRNEMLAHLTELTAILTEPSVYSSRRDQKPSASA